MSPEQLECLLSVGDAAQPGADPVTALTRLLRGTIDSLSHPLYIIDVRDRRVLLANAACQLPHLGGSVTCHAATHGLPRPCSAYGHRCPLDEVVTSRRPATAEHAHFDEQGRARICEVHCYPITGADGEVSHVVEYNLDVTERRTSQDQLRFLATAIEATANGVFITDRAGTIQWLNEAFCRLSGYSRAAAIGKRASMLRSGCHDDAFYQHLWQTISAGDVWRGRVINRHRNGSLFIVEQTITPLADCRGEIASFVAVHEDVTARAEAEQRLHHAARYDYLTDLPNRLTFTARVDRELAGATGRGGELAVLLVNLDHFREVNEAFGQTAGDTLLLAVSDRLRQAVRQTDLLARYGGDEFVVLQNPGGSPESLGDVARRLLAALATPFEVAGRELRATATIGIALGSPASGDEMLQQAASALRRAKDDERGGFRFFAPEVDERVRARMALAFDLGGALERNEIFLEYQPQVDLASGAVVRAEALLRWRHPTHGLVGPADFVPLAERNDMIGPIGAWALRSACREARAWSTDTGIALPLAVNISATQLLKAGFGDAVAAILEETGFAPDALELEITERVLLQESPAMLENLRVVRELGVSLAIDDFGTGYSSFEYLKRCTVQTLKVDRRFVQNMTTDAGDHAIVSTLLQLARRLGLRHVVEGVETDEQLCLLRQEGCEVVQGFYFSRPISSPQLARLLDAQASGGVLTRVTAKRPIECEHRARRVAALPGHETLARLTGRPGFDGSPLGRLRRQEGQAREVGTIASRVAGQQRQPADRGMRADVEVGQRRATDAALLSVPQEALASQEGGGPG